MLVANSIAAHNVFFLALLCTRAKNLSRFYKERKKTEGRERTVRLVYYVGLSLNINLDMFGAHGINSMWIDLPITTSGFEF